LQKSEGKESLEAESKVQSYLRANNFLILLSCLYGQHICI
jgi:hypothetical protein